MSDSSEIYHSPPQTPQPDPLGDDSDLESQDSNSTILILDHPSPDAHILLPPTTILSSLEMSSEQTTSHDSSTVPSIHNLSDNDWSTWYSAMESYFLIKDLDGILDESEAPPPKSDRLGSGMFLKRKKHVAGIIGLKLSDPIRELLVTDTNRRDPVLLWRDIKAHFALTKARNRGQVFAKLFSLTCSGNEIAEFITSTKKTLKELASIGVKTDSEMIAHFLLHLLPPSFDMFKDMVIHTAEAADTALSVNSVINLLSQHVNNKKVQLSTSTNVTAFSAQNSSKTGPLGRFKQPICINGKHNPSTQNSAECCWQLHPELQTPRNPAHAANLTVSSNPNLLPSTSEPQPTPPAMTPFLLAAFSKFNSKVESILDSGASAPMFRDKNYFKTYTNHVEDVSLADGTQIKTQGHSVVDLTGTDSSLQLSSCLHIPSLAHNLISLSYLCNKGCQLVYLGNNQFEVPKDGQKVFGGNIRIGVFVLNITVGKPSPSALTSTTPSDSLMLLHRRLGHLNFGYIHKLNPSVLNSTPPPCLVCMLNKHHRLPLPGRIPRPSCPLEFVHSDLSDCVSPPSINGYWYYFKLTDGYPKYKHVYFLKHKSETFKYFLEIKNLVEKQTNSQIKRMVNDNGGEYLDGEFQRFLKREGIIMDTTASYTPQQNPISERGNRTTTERACCMLINANLSKKFWAKAVETAVYKENRSPEASLKLQTPHKLWFGTKANLSHLRIFRCSAYKLIPKKFRGSNFPPTSEKLILLGYQDRLHNYQLLNPANNKVTYCYNVIFDEFYFEHLNLSLNHTSNRPDILLEDVPETSRLHSNHTLPNEPVDLEIECSTSTPTAVDSSNSPTTSLEPESTTAVEPVSGTKQKFLTYRPDPPAPSKEISASIDTRKIIEGQRRRLANSATGPNSSPRT